MTDNADLNRYRSNLQDETDSAALYETMAELEDKPEIATIYRRLASVEQAHANYWRHQLERHGSVAPSRPSWRARVLIWLTRRFGANAVLPTVLGQEASNFTIYDTQPESAHTEMPAQERSHARILAHLASRRRGGWNGGRYAQLEGRHGSSDGNTLRAAVLGANDGLVSTLSLIMGAAGAAFSSQAILTTALAGTLAGACSMAMGEWISVRSARELYQRQIASEAEELRQVPAEEREELALIYQSKGFTAEEARQIASRVMSSPDSALDTLVREELGIDPDDLGGSAGMAAVSSFLVFLVGAAIPALPLVFLHGSTAVSGSALAGALGLFLIGAAITLFTNRPVLRSGLRQLVIGIAAAGVTYGAGWLFGVTVGG